MRAELHIEDENLTMAWGRALQSIVRPGNKEAAPLIVSVTGFDRAGHFRETPAVRKKLDALLLARNTESVQTVANTIFPESLWNPKAKRELLFERYKTIGPHIHNASRKNRRGIYFERMISNGPLGHENQLEFVIQAYRSRRGVRRSVLQVAIFDPRRDHSAAALLGFPCLQHVTFAPTSLGLNVNAFYATQYIVGRAYGNYVGLCRLGRFVAHELGVPLVRVTCFAGIGELDVGKRHLERLLAAVNAASTQQ